jgi:transcriptional regulator with XRE-family HTH domain
MLTKGLNVATPTLRDLARAAGVSYFAIRQYRRGQRTPSATVLRRLARVLRDRGGKLGKLADELEAVAARR